MADTQRTLVEVLLRISREQGFDNAIEDITNVENTHVYTYAPNTILEIWSSLSEEARLACLLICDHVYDRIWNDQVDRDC